MLFISWGFVLCLIILSSHVSSNTAKSLVKGQEQLKLSTDELVEEVKGNTVIDSVYKSIGKRMVLSGVFSVVLLLAMFLTKPFLTMGLNITIFVINGLIVSALLGYIVEGLFLWNNSLESVEEITEGD
jgi:hypothetical protein